MPSGLLRQFSYSQNKSQYISDRFPLPRIASSLHLPVSYLPWTVGGKEVYCHSLCAELRSGGHQAVVAIHRNEYCPVTPGKYQHEGVPVHVLPEIEAKSTRDVVYSLEPSGVPGFAELIQRLRPSVVHFHDFSPGANLRHMRIAKAAGAHIVMCYHSPGQTCLQRSLWRNGEEGNICNGVIDRAACTRCRLADRGVPPALSFSANLLSFFPFNAEGTSRLARFATAPKMTEKFVRAWKECIQLVDAFHAHSRWAIDVLRVNGIPESKIRQILAGTRPKLTAATVTETLGDGPLRIGFFGRCDPVKGVHVLIDAVERVPPEVKIQVSMFGPYWEGEYGRTLTSRIVRNPRFKPVELIQPGQVSSKMASLDLCIVPSLWLETGPLVVLEAFESKVPVAGSRLGGIAELVTHGVDGLLFAPGDADALSRLITKVSTDRGLLADLRRNIKPVRKFREVADEILALYESLRG